MSPNSRNKPSVLFVGAGTPWMGGAGYLVRQQMLLKALARLDIDLHLAMFDPQHDEPPPPPPFRADVTYVPHARPLKESRWRSLVNDIVLRDPMLIRTLDCSLPREAVARLKPSRFDAVVAYRCDFAHASGVLSHRNLILDIDDPEHVRRMDAAQWADDGNAVWQRALDLRRLKRFELSCARQAKACFVCQDRDASPFRDIGLDPIVVPNCVEVPATLPLRSPGSPTVLFVGNMEGSETAPNVDGVRWLVKEVWPMVLARAPEAQCVIAGPIRRKWREEIAGVSGVRVVGFVDDLAELLRSASVSIAPIRFGTGTRIKILEAMAAGSPVVSTTKGCEGLQLQPASDLLIGDLAADFANACVRLLRDPVLAENIGRSGWQAVFDRYNRSRNEQWLADVLAGLIGVPKSAERHAA